MAPKDTLATRKIRCRFPSEDLHSDQISELLSASGRPAASRALQQGSPVSVQLALLHPATRAGRLGGIAAEADLSPELFISADQRSTSVNYEAWNRYVLIAIGVFAGVVYLGLMCTGIAEFVSRLSKSGKTRRRSRNRVAARRLRNGKV
jgi:hypothetical protein